MSCDPILKNESGMTSEVEVSAMEAGSNRGRKSGLEGDEDEGFMG